MCNKISKEQMNKILKTLKGLVQGLLDQNVHLKKRELGNLKLEAFQFEVDQGYATLMVVFEENRVLASQDFLFHFNLEGQEGNFIDYSWLGDGAYGDFVLKNGEYVTLDLNKVQTELLAFMDSYCEIQEEGIGLAYRGYKNELEKLSFTSEDGEIVVYEVQ